MKDGRLRKTPFKLPSRLLTIEKARKMHEIFPPLPKAYLEYDRRGKPMGETYSDGTGRLHPPKGGWRIEGDPVARYLKAMGAPGCCTVDDPCTRHRGALRGRDWETGEYL